jgi:hypothetical protein
MTMNLAFDLAIGLIPFAGDVADIVWKANTRNLSMLERHVALEQPPTRADYVFVGAVVSILAGLATAPFVLVALVLRALGIW